MNTSSNMDTSSKKTIENQMGISLKKIREWLQPYISKVFE